MHQLLPLDMVAYLWCKQQIFSIHLWMILTWWFVVAEENNNLYMIKVAIHEFQLNAAWFKISLWSYEFIKKFIKS